MPKLLQINITANWGSTGVVAEGIGQAAIDNGWDSYIAYGECCNESTSTLIRIGSRLNQYFHYGEQKLLDNEGQCSRWVTKRFINIIKKLNPDIIHLHNIHDHFFNYKILFKYLNTTNIPVVWTFHDFWVITGRCYHFVGDDCIKWKTGCYDCPQKKRLLPIKEDYVKKYYNLKKELFTDNNNLHIVSVSDWVGDCVKDSFLGAKDTRVIYNGVDCSVFRPRSGFTHPAIQPETFMILAVSSQWKSEGKGLNDYISLSKLLKKNEVIVLVGVTDDIIEKLPDKIIGIKRTNSQVELAELYTRADVVLSLSSAETFGLTIVEGYACGTPAVVYNNTAPPALITSETGFVVNDKDYAAAYKAIEVIKEKGKNYYSKSCVKLACEKYNKEICYKQYVKLYNDLLMNKKQVRL